MKIIDISGFGHSGKTAVTDLLREVEGVNVHHSSFEFNLLRLPDGLIDLKRNILDNWSPSKSDFAIKRFRRLCLALKSNYSEQLNVDFYRITSGFIDSLIEDILEINWYDNLYDTRNNRLKNLIREFLKISGLLSFSRKIRKGEFININSKKDLVYLVNQEGLVSNAVNYLEQILNPRNCRNNTIVTNNAFGPFNPTESMSLFNEAYCVIVDRDPRDIYLSALAKEKLFIPEFENNNPVFSLTYLQELKKDMLGIRNINTFIYRQKQYRKNIKFQYDTERVIRINYEDLVCDYEQTVLSLFEKLSINPSKHTNKLKHFNPENSKKNVGLWKNKRDITEIVKIEIELNEYLYKK